MLDRRVAPVFNRNFDFQLITPEHVKLNNGIDVFLINGGDQNVLKIDLIFPAGRWNENVWGSSYFTANLLLKGTSTRSSFEIASAFDQLGAHLDVVSGVDYVTISLYSLTRNLSQALELMATVVLDSVFPEKELQQSKSVYVQTLKINQEKTSFLSSRLFRKTLFGDSHPYGKELTEAEVAKLDRNDITSFYEERFTDFLVVVSGKIEAVNSDKILGVFSAFKNKSLPIHEHVQVPSSQRQCHATKEDSLQSSLRVGKKTINRTHADYPSLILLNHIFGGYFGSRLMKNIREDKGLTYGIYSSINAMKNDTYIAIGTDVNKESRELAFAEIRKELHRLCTEAISEDELNTARNHFIGSFQAELSTPFAHAEKLKTLVLCDLSKDHYNNLLSKISQAKPSDLLATANRYLVNDSFYEISVG